MANRPAVVCKLGGSLLDSPALPDLVRGLRVQRPDHALLLVVGGGPAADIVRTWDRVHRIGEEASHQFALDAMTFNESLLRHLVPELSPVRNAKQFHAATGRGSIGLLCAGCFLRWAETLPPDQVPEPLPHTWGVTSDSIAAWVALCLHADELILVKSVEMPGCSAAAAARSGLVDAYFPQLAARLKTTGWLSGLEPGSRVTAWLEPASD